MSNAATVNRLLRGLQDLTLAGVLSERQTERAFENVCSLANQCGLTVVKAQDGQYRALKVRPL